MIGVASEDYEEKRFFEYVEIGQAIPGDAEINNALPDDLPNDCKLIYFINGEEVNFRSYVEASTLARELPTPAESEPEPTTPDQGTEEPQG